MKDALLNPYLHKDYDEQSKMIEATAPGQASWVVLSSKATCRQCRDWGRSPVALKDKWGNLLPQVCLKYERMLRVKSAFKVPADAIACKFSRPENEKPSRDTSYEI